MHESQKKYVENIQPYFNSKLDDDQRLLDTINRFLEFHNFEKIKDKNKILDIGSGKGTFVEVCKKRGIIASGIDGAKNNINFEKDKLPFENNTFDFISMIAVIEHIQNKEILMNEIKRVSKNNSILIITTPNFKYCYKSFYNDPTHVSPFTEISLKKFLDNYGHKDINLGPYVVNKSAFFWRAKYSFFLASMLPFTNHDFKGSKMIPSFLRGKSTSIISISKIKK